MEGQVENSGKKALTSRSLGLEATYVRDGEVKDSRCISCVFHLYFILCRYLFVLLVKKSISGVINTTINEH